MVFGYEVFLAIWSIFGWSQSVSAIPWWYFSYMVFLPIWSISAGQNRLPDIRNSLYPCRVPTHSLGARAKWHFLLRSLAQNGTHLAGSLRQRMEFRVEISSPFESHVCLSGTDKMDLHSTQPLASNAALLSPSRMNGVREIWQARRRRRRSDKSFICQFQHLARPPSAFSQAELWRGA